MADLFQSSSAVISDCGTYRYRLDRNWREGRKMGFIMLNPSTADADQDDPTIRRCKNFAKREGCDGIIVVNLFPFRATKPADLWAQDAPTRMGGPDGEKEFFKAISEMDMVVAAWGADARGGDHWVQQRFGSCLWCLGRTKDGHPRHPLYVMGDAPMVKLWEANHG